MNPLTHAELSRYRRTVARHLAAIESAGKELATWGLSRTYLMLSTLRCQLGVVQLLEAIDEDARHPAEPRPTLAIHHESHTACTAGPSEPGHQNPLALPAWAEGAVPDPPRPEDLPVLAPNRSRR